MLQKRRIGRSRRIPTVEVLEDRTVLSGNIFASQNLFTGVVTVANSDNGNHNYTITQTGALGFPTLSVTGTTTAVNFIPNGTANFPLASVSEIDVFDGNGTNTIKMSLIQIPGNIRIAVGSGIDTVSLSRILTNAGQITYSAIGARSFVSEDTIVAGNSVINTGTGRGTITQNNVTFGFDKITTGGTRSSVTVTNSIFAPAPRTSAIGQLSIATNGGQDTVNVDKISVGPATVTMANTTDHDHPDNLTFDDSTLQSGSITVGTEAAATNNNHFMNVSNDIVTGGSLTVNSLNQSGVSGVLIPGTPGTGPGSLTFLTMNNVQFSGGGNMNVRVDDGVTYFFHDNDGDELLDGDNGGYDSNPGGSKVTMTLIDSLANDSVFTIHLGDHMQNSILGAGTIGLNDLDSGHLVATVGSDNATVIVSAIEADDESVSIGDVTLGAPTGNISVLPTPPSVTINGSVGVTDSDNDSDSMTVMLGNNNNNTGHPIIGWPVTVQESVAKDLTIQGLTPAAPPNGVALTVTSTSVGGLLTITLGNGGPNGFESLTETMVTSSDQTITAATVAADAPDGTPKGFVVNLTNVNTNDPTGGLTLTDTGAGVDLVTMTNVNAIGMLMVGLSSSGMNVLSAMNVTTLFGMVDGGLGFGNIYIDLGGNFGYFVTDFVGH